MEKYKKRAVQGLCILLVILLIGCVVQNVVLTNGGTVRVEDVSWVTDDGAYLTARLFIPEGVDADTPAPAVVACHGYNNTLEVQEVNAIELSRRGYVVIAPDAYGHGNSTASVGLMSDDDALDGVQDDTVGVDEEGDAATQDGGVYSALQYLGTLPFVDREHIGLVGHSMGGYTIQMAANRAFLNQASDASVVVPKSLFIMCEGKDIDYTTYAVSVATLTPEFDEFAQGHWNINVPSEANTSAKLKSLLGLDESDPDIEYGAFCQARETAPISQDEALAAADKGVLRVSYLLDGRTHPGAHNSFKAVEYIGDFFNITLKEGVQDTIGLDDQTWLIKNIAGLICLICFFLLAIPVAVLLINTKLFSSLCRKPYPGTQLSDTKQKIRYILLFMIGMIPPALLFYPVMGNPICVKFMRFISTIPWQDSDLFPMPVMNGYALFDLLCGVISLAIFIVIYKTTMKKSGIQMEQTGMKISVRDLLKTLLLAVITFLAVYMTLALAGYFLKVDYRFFTLSIKTITPVKWTLYVRYVLFFAVFYVANSLSLNLMTAIQSKKEWINYLLCIVQSTGGLFILFLLDYGGLYRTGVKLLASYSSMGGNSSLAGILSWGLLFVLPLAAITARNLYKKTGNIWIGGLINTLTVTLFALSNTAISRGIF